MTEDADEVFGAYTPGLRGYWERLVAPRDNRRRNRKGFTSRIEFHWVTKPQLVL